nr:hypothetical protein [Sphingobium sp. Z007]
MALFEYFPNYIWNLSVSIAMESGAQLGEIIDMCQPIRDAATPRAVAYEPRFASGAVWGANHNWAEVQQKRLNRKGENPVPHYWAHVMWAFGASDMEDFHAKSADMNLNGHMDRIIVPFLVTHGAKDRQISLSDADNLYDQLVNSPRREKVIFTDSEGGVEHVGADNMAYGRDAIADWFAETLDGRTA